MNSEISKLTIEELYIHIKACETSIDYFTRRRLDRPNSKELIEANTNLSMLSTLLLKLHNELNKKLKKLS